jgi:hypothetical protein
VFQKASFSTIDVFLQQVDGFVERFKYLESFHYCASHSQQTILDYQVKLLFLVD